jgi:small nuclear ribonucleoprotein (snRNP)-like protein
MEMSKLDKVIRALECTHTDGIECQNCPYWKEDDCAEILNEEVIVLLKEQEETINDLTDTIRQLNQHIKDLSEYMTPYGKLEDVKACAELLKEKEPIEPEMIMDGLIERYRCKCGAHLFKSGDYRWDYCPYCGKKMKWE